MPYKVLVIEDYAPFAKLVKEHYLRGHDVTIVCTLAEALSALHRESWDAICLDLGLPDVDSQTWDACRKVIEVSARIPLIIVTGGEREPGPYKIVKMLGKDKLVHEPGLLNQIVTAAVEQAAALEAGAVPSPS